MYTIIAYLSSSSNPKDYKCKKGQERREHFYSGECSFVVHLNENLCNESFSWSFERKNLCRPCYEGQRLVEVCLSLVAGKVRLSVTLLWLKFLVLNSFPCFAGFFDHPPLNTREHDRLKHETKEKRQISILERKKIGSTPNSENKMKKWGSIRPPFPIKPASIRHLITVLYLGK